MQISELYRKSKMGEELKEFSNKMLASKDTSFLDYKSRTFKQILCDKKSYNNSDFDVYRNMTYGFTTSAYSNILEFCNKYSKSIEYNISPDDLVKFSHVLGKNILNIDHNDVEQLQNAINKSVDEYTAIPLSDILSCSNFINVFKDPESDIKNQLRDLLSKHTEMSYDDVKKAVDSSSLSPENKKIVFAEVLPAYNFKVCNNFQDTWDMFEKGYIDFDTLVTKFWIRNDFDKDQNNTDRQNVFQTFASYYIGCLNNQANKLDGLVSSANGMNGMIDVLKEKGVISENDVQNLKNQIGNATNVTIVGVIIQFFANLFNGKIACKAKFKLEQDRAISNLEPLSGILRQAAERNKEGSDKLI